MAKNPARAVQADAGQIAAAEVTLLPLEQLTRSPYNVRTRSDEGLEALAESIAAQGLLQNLIVHPNEDGTLYGVADGDRRFQALLMLAAAGRIAHDHPVPVQIKNTKDCVALSLTANKQRLDMSPVDEALAFDRVVKATKKKPAAIAVLYGVTKRYVEQRLKLASIAPPILYAASQGQIDLDVLQAFTVTDDHAKQLDVWGAMRGAMERGEDTPDAAEVRDALTAEFIEPDHKMVLFIGIEAYRQAGGGFNEDLFLDNDATLLTDKALVVKLAKQKLRKQSLVASVKAEGWKWVEVDPQYRQGTMTFAAYTDDNGKYDPEEMALCGAVVTLRWDGFPQVVRGLCREEDNAAFAALIEARETMRRAEDENFGIVVGNGGEQKYCQHGIEEGGDCDQCARDEQEKMRARGAAIVAEQVAKDAAITARKLRMLDEAKQLALAIRRSMAGESQLTTDELRGCVDEFLAKLDAIEHGEG